MADYEQPINGEIMKAVASRVTDPKTDVLLLPAVDMDDSGPYEIAEPRVITALETYTPSWLQTPRLKRLAEIVSAQAVVQHDGDGDDDDDDASARDTKDDNASDAALPDGQDEYNVQQEDVPPLAEGEDWSHMNGHQQMAQEVA